MLDLTPEFCVTLMSAEQKVGRTMRRASRGPGRRNSLALWSSRQGTISELPCQLRTFRGAYDGRIAGIRTREAGDTVFRAQVASNPVGIGLGDDYFALNVSKEDREGRTDGKASASLSYVGATASQFEHGSDRAAG
jgi:hypothetical protein